MPPLGEVPCADRWVLVPIKAFSAAKARLGPVLGAPERARLAEAMAERVLHAAAPLPVAVACDDHDVAAFAEAHGSLVLWTPGLGLNGAVMAGLERLQGEGAAYVTVVHADLPLAADVGSLAHHDGVTIAPDRRRVGTNLLRVPTSAGFCVQFGRDSFARHLEECERLGLAVLVLEREDLAFDVDEPGDLAELGTRNGGTP